MFTYLVLLFTVLPAMELYLLLKIGSHIGAANTFLIIVFTGVLGAYLAKLQGFFILKRIQENLNNGNMPSSELIDGAMVLVGGIVLLTPGFITDIIGFLLLIPLTRSLIKLWVEKRFKNVIKSGSNAHIGTFTSEQQNYNRYDDIDIN